MTIGIYAFKNKNTGKFYVGASKQIEIRKIQHLNLLRVGKHHSIKFQRSYNKHGEHSFEFIILKKLSDASLLEEVETEFIEQYNAWSNGYNALKKGTKHFEYPNNTIRNLENGVLKSARIKLKSSYFSKTCTYETSQWFFDLSHRELAELTGIAHSTWSDYFKKKSSPTLKTLEIVANKLGMEPLDFIAAFRERCEIYGNK